MPYPKNKSFKSKKQFLLKEKLLDSKHSAIIIALGLIFILYHMLVEPITIGQDVRYKIYIFLLPVIIGMLALGLYRREFLLNRISAEKSVSFRIVRAGFYLLQGFLFSYLILGQTVAMTWDYLNYQEAKTQPMEQFYCELNEIVKGGQRRSNPNIRFKWEGKYEQINTSYASIKDYLDKDPEAYRIQLRVRKGIWNYYLLEGWSLQEK